MIKDFLQILFKSILFVLLPLVLFTLITSKSNLVFGIRSYVVLTGSMEPSIPTASIIFTIPDQIYRNGEIIAFKMGDKTVTHRIVATKDLTNKNISNLISPIFGSPDLTTNLQYQTKGDANNSLDTKLVSKKEVVGKMLFYIPEVGRLINFLKTPLGFILLIVVPTFIYVGFELLKIKKELDKKLEKKLMERFKMQGI